MKKVSCFLVVASASIGVAQAQYNVTDLSPSPGPGGYAQAYGTTNGQQYGMENGFAAIWNGSSASYQTFGNGGNSTTQINGSSGGYQVGNGDLGNALLWHGASSSPTTLTGPAGFLGYNFAQGISGTNIAGYGIAGIRDDDSFIYQAIRWGGLGSAAVNLGAATDGNSNTLLGSAALGISGSQEVGWGNDSTDPGDQHAILWTSDTNFVDLDPTGTMSQANATDGTDQVGYTSAADGNFEATMWDGSAASLDLLLNPAGTVSSVANGVLDGKVVGYVTDAGDISHATLWEGSSYTELTTPVGFINTYATGIDADGDIVGYGFDKVDGEDHALLWTPQSTPGPAAALPFAIGLLRRRRRRARVA